MLKKKTSENTEHYEYNPFETAKRFKEKLDEALAEYDKFFERMDFYRLVKEGYRLFCRDIKNYGGKYD